MKNKFFYLATSFIVYNIIIIIISNKYPLSILFFVPILFYAVIAVKLLAAVGKRNESNSTSMFMEESNEESVGSTSYFEKKKTEEPKIQIGFDDVAGLEEIKEDLMDVIDFLNNEEKYKSMDAKVPRGILLYGPPGTGKTLIAKAVAGEAKATFIYSSGSEFVEKYVGVGAKRVRMIFERARKESPSIIFIDEIDALGAKRNTESNNEKDQTLNQLLIELDGFNNVNNVIVIAATNRIDLLDDALLRPGRFDRKIYVGNPNYHSRLRILEVHTKNKPLDKRYSSRT